MLAEKTDLATRDLAPLIGTAVLADKKALLGGEHAGAIRELLEKRGVLVFPQIHFTDAEQIAFTATLGTFARELRGEEIYKVTLDKGENATAEYLKGAFYWHIDGTMSPMPILASILSAKVLSKTGGDTEFSNTYAAYDALPDADKQALEGVKVVHTLSASQKMVESEPTYEKYMEWRKLGQDVQPLVWTHRSGRKSLVLGATCDHVVGMDPLESQALLIRLRDFATQPRFVYSHKWTVGDTVMWDNTGTMHRATEYPLDSGRMMHRTKLQGEEPFA